MWDNLPANPTPHLSNETPFASNRIRQWIMCVLCNSNLLKCKVICFRHFEWKPWWMFPWYFTTFFPYLFFDHMFSIQLCQQNQKLYDSVDIDTLGGQDLVSHRKIDPCQSESNRCILLLRFSEFPLLEVTLSKSNKYYENWI